MHASLRLPGLAAALLISAEASAYEVRIDQFTVVRDTVTIFDDMFGDGVPPPNAPNFSNATAANYFTNGTFLESAGKALMDSDLGSKTAVTTAHLALLNTNTDSANTVNGLKKNHAFSITGFFDLSLPTTAAGQYGIRLTDGRAASPGNDTLDLLVRLDDDGMLRVVFRKLDLLTPALTIVDSTPLDPTPHDQIRLTMSHLAGDTDITASFAYVDGGVAGPTTTFAAEASIFNGELFTRAGFLASELTVPEPSTIALLAGTFLLLGAARARRLS